MPLLPVSAIWRLPPLSTAKAYGRFNPCDISVVIILSGVAPLAACVTVKVWPAMVSVPMTKLQTLGPDGLRAPR